MIQVANLSVNFGSQRVLHHVSWHVGRRDRIGLVGNNGSGKSTLMKIIAGLQHAEEGEVALVRGTTIGYLPQDGVAHTGRTLYDEAASALGNLQSWQAEEAEILSALEDPATGMEDHEELGLRLAEVQEHLRLADGYRMEERIGKVLVGLGFAPSDMTRGCGEFSGGWQMRIALAKVLLSEPNLLLLDEPTNYLDLEARMFLLSWLGSYPHAIVMVSHDRHFLDQLISRITEIHDGKLTDYYCNYSRYLIEREVRVEQLRAKAEQIEEERARIQQFIDRFRYQAAKAVQVQTRVKMLEKLEKVEIPSVRKKIRFHFPQPERAGKIVIEAENLTAGYEGRPNVVKNVSFQMVRGEKVALVGVNGAGKSTLMKVLAGFLPPSSGSFKFGHNVSWDYFAQDVQKQLDPALTVYDTLKHGCPFDLVPQLRNLLGAFLFSGEEIEKRVAVLSGGERNRVALARMLLTPSNVLLMDEPTNHLDLDAKDVLLEALQSFEGSVLFVSHDRYFLDNLSTRVYALDNGELYNYPGTYPDFLLHMQARDAAKAATNARSPEAKAERRQQAEKSADKEERVKSYEEAKRRQREKERLGKAVEKLEADIAAKENESKTLLRQMAEPQYATAFAELEKLVAKKERVDKELSKLSDEWAKAAEALEEVLAQG